MNLGYLVGALEGKAEGRTRWRCQCPVHGGRSLFVTEQNGRLLVHCFKGCDQKEVVKALKARGLWFGRMRYAIQPAQTDRPPDDSRRQERALALYANAGNSKSCARYLRNRGITIPAPSVLRLGREIWHPQSRTCADAIVALVEHEWFGPTGVHLTYLDEADARKAVDLDPNKQMRGAIAGGAVRLGEPEPGEWLVIGTGIQTTLSVMQMKDLPGWAVLSDSGLSNLILPDECRQILIAGDNDAHGGGQIAAYGAAGRFLAQGHKVTVAIPPDTETDWNDVLLQQGT